MNKILPERKQAEREFHLFPFITPKCIPVHVLFLFRGGFNNTYLMIGELDYQEKVVGTNSHIML